MELMVALGVLVLLVGIMFPYLHRVREAGRRTACSNNLSKLGLALSQYGAANRDELPRVVYNDKEQSHNYTAFTGADAESPFNGKPNGVVANDVTASLWLLVRNGYISSEITPPSAVFVCPSSGDDPDPLLGPEGKHVGPRMRSNFRARNNLSYSYADPFSNATGYGLKSDFLPSGFVLVADKNPGRQDKDQDATGAAFSDPPQLLKTANSRNHGQAGQNVLFGDMHVEWRETPYCGVDADNIYTAQAFDPLSRGEARVPNVRGYIGRDVAPASPTDSYLVPVAGD